MRFTLPHRLVGGFVLGAISVVVLRVVMGVVSSCADEETLLNPRLPCEAADQGEWKYEILRDALTQKKMVLKEEGKVTHLSMYFRDLGNGPRFGIGEYDKFQPASLLKVPIMIALLHEADLQPSLLQKTLSFSGSLNIAKNVYESEYTILPHTSYTLRELLERMIVHSDNYSYAMLTREISDPSPLLAYYTFRDLDVHEMMLEADTEYVSIQPYGNLFAILYNTGYLSREMSQYALTLLSRSTYDSGLVAGVPPDVRVAHKFGVHDNTEEIQLHDCGIIYHPDTPYVLCVMTSGTSRRVLESVIADVSKTVYDDITERNL